MIRIWLLFVVLSILIHFGISAWRTLTGLERWELTKSVAYSTIVSSLALIVMAVIYIEPWKQF